MRDLLILGTDTGVGKTTLAALFLACFAKEFAYWKPIETGESDSGHIERLVPAATVFPPVLQLAEAVAPVLAARRAQLTVPSASNIADSQPTPKSPARALVIESFGGPLSPLNDTQLQTALIQNLHASVVVVTPSAVGAIGRTLQTLTALEHHAIHAVAVVLVGDEDKFAVELIFQHAALAVFSLRPPASWSAEAVETAARRQTSVLQALRDLLVEKESDRQDATKVEASAADMGSSFSPGDVEKLLANDRKYVWHPYSRLLDTSAPVVCVGAEKEFLVLADGRRVIDGISSWWTILHGHRHPPLVAALQAALEKIDHVQFAGVTHAYAVELAELLLTSLGRRSGRVFYSDDGSTAVEAALKLAYEYWVYQGEPLRRSFIGFQGGYHGDTFGAMAVGRDPLFFGNFEPLLFEAKVLPLSAEALDATLYRHRGEIAAVIVEPLVQAAGGMKMHSPELLRSLFEVARGHDVLFIADEVMTGGGRTGSLWAHQAAGIEPDLICAAKTLAGGLLPMAATIVKQRIADCWEAAGPKRIFFHGHSFTAHPLACAVAVANWRALLAGPILAPGHAAIIWETELAPLRDLPQVEEVRICGTIAAVELKAAGGYLSEVGPRLREVCLAKGVLLRPLGNVLYSMPPFCTSAESLERTARAMQKAIESVASV